MTNRDVTLSLSMKIHPMTVSLSFWRVQARTLSLYNLTCILHSIQRNMSAILSVVQQMGAAWANLANKRQRCDSDSPPQKLHRFDDLEDLVDLFSNANKSGDDDDNWDLLDDIEDLKGDDEKVPLIKEKLAQKVNDQFMGNLGSEKIAAKKKGLLVPE